MSTSPLTRNSALGRSNDSGANLLPRPAAKMTAPRTRKGSSSSRPASVTSSPSVTRPAEPSERSALLAEPSEMPAWAASSRCVAALLVARDDRTRNSR